MSILLGTNCDCNLLTSAHAGYVLRHMIYHIWHCLKCAGRHSHWELVAVSHPKALCHITISHPKALCHIIILLQASLLYRPATSAAKAAPAPHGFGCTCKAPDPFTTSLQANPADNEVTPPCHLQHPIYAHDHHCHSI